MSLNSVGVTNGNSPKLPDKVSIEYSGDNQEQLLSTESKYDSVEFSNKPKFLPSLGKGILRSVAMIIPIFGSYVTGGKLEENKYAKEVLEDLQDGKIDEEHKEGGAIKKILKGIGFAILTSIPFIGTYFLGKNANEISNVAKTIDKIQQTGEMQEVKKSGFFSNYFKGVAKKLSFVPIIGTYFFGKEAINAKNNKKDADALLDVTR